MFFVKRMDSYLTVLAKKYGITNTDCKQILKFFLFNVRRSIRKGEEIHIEKFGRIGFKKSLYEQYLKKRKNNGLSSSNSRENGSR